MLKSGSEAKYSPHIQRFTSSMSDIVAPTNGNDDNRAKVANYHADLRMKSSYPSAFFDDIHDHDSDVSYLDLVLDFGQYVGHMQFEEPTDEIFDSEYHCRCA
ncbi:hypothetical protein N7495_006413 [Penicillium taxi]|uniref:uncharacterized protein n=1 Tax=Penicillium taxi TaxID=168475 RepID=UPI002545B61A|nr:uncharacterized protein N7495_006413 [Penicillium taxi]KAJ5894722.1 hypothetical protein N7495_006413 [Penicillium taxi]